MKLYFTFLIITSILFGCKKADNSFPVTSFENELEMKKWDSIYTKFQKFEIELYKASKIEPQKVLVKIDSLKLEYKDDLNISSDLHYFKAELLYQLGEYEKSIEELKIMPDESSEIQLICNYVKLKNFGKAETLFKSLPINEKGFNAFIYANYLEVIHRKSEAIKIYLKINLDDSNRRFFYHQLATERFKALSTGKPIVLESIYYPTSNPNFNENSETN